MNPRTLIDVLLVLLGIYCISEGAIESSQGLPSLLYERISTYDISSAMSHFVPSIAFFVLAWMLLRYGRGITTKIFWPQETTIQRTNRLIENWYILAFCFMGILIAFWMIPIHVSTMMSYLTLFILEPTSKHKISANSMQYGLVLSGVTAFLQVVIGCSLIMWSKHLTHFIRKMQRQ